MDHVTLVDEAGNVLGSKDKHAAHEDGGVLHLAFSIIVFDESGRILLQRRALEKYHFAGLWSNSCCGHPRLNEGVVEGGERRLHEEFGFTTSLQDIGSLVYRATDEASGLTEHELLHVLHGVWSGEPAANPDEIVEWRWVEPGTLDREIEATPDVFTPWFRRLVAEGLVKQR